MSPEDLIPCRRLIQATAAAGVTALAASAKGEEAKSAAQPLRVGVISAAIRGKPQPRNGHTWHFAQYLHPAIDLDAYCKMVDPGSAEFIRLTEPCFGLRWSPGFSRSCATTSSDQSERPQVGVF